MGKMNFKHVAIIAIAIILLSLGATYAYSAVNRTPVCVPLINESFDKEAVSVNDNSLFIVSLPENPSTGYVYTNKTSSGLKIICDEFIPDSDLIGAGGNQTWLIKTLATGNQSFIAYLNGPDGNVTDTFSILVQVS